MMKIALIGYGKMGKAIEKIAVERGHEIVFKATVEESNFSVDDLRDVDVAIEFTAPDAAVDNIYKCFTANVPVVVGTTGWYDRFGEISQACHDQQQGLFHATNFSVGVNVFFEINKRLAQLMQPHEEYDVAVEETHHIHKLDAPSGTAITIAEGILEQLSRKKIWTNNKDKAHPNELNINSIRENEVPGTHEVSYASEIDTITITHAAKSRKGFALGAVLAAEFMMNKHGVYSMKDLLQL